MRFYLNKRSVNDFEARQHQDAIVRDFLKNQNVDPRNLGVSTDHLRKAAYLQNRNKQELLLAYQALEAACTDSSAIAAKSKHYKDHIETRFEGKLKNQVQRSIQ